MNKTTDDLLLRLHNIANLIINSNPSEFGDDWFKWWIDEDNDSIVPDFDGERLASVSVLLKQESCGKGCCPVNAQILWLENYCDLSLDFVGMVNQIKKQGVENEAKLKEEQKLNLHEAEKSTLLEAMSTIETYTPTPFMESRTEPPWDELDEGIKKAVRFIWDNGYQPTDSGDGSKIDYMEGALPFPHVIIQLDSPHTLISAVDQLTKALSGTEWESWEVEGSYAYKGPAIITFIKAENPNV